MALLANRRGTEVVVTGSTRNRLVPLIAGHVGSNPTLSAIKPHVMGKTFNRIDTMFILPIKKRSRLGVLNYYFTFYCL
jgi:hypothetical protein